MNFLRLFSGALYVKRKFLNNVLLRFILNNHGQETFNYFNPTKLALLADLNSLDKAANIRFFVNLQKILKVFIIA